MPDTKGSAMKGLLEPNRVTEVAVGTLCSANSGLPPAGWVFLDGTTQQQTWFILDLGKFPWLPQSTMQLSKPEDDAASATSWTRVTTAAEFKTAYTKYIDFHVKAGSPPGAIVYANQEVIDGVPRTLPDPPKLPSLPSRLPVTPAPGASTLHLAAPAPLQLQQVEVGPIGGVCQAGLLVGAVMASRYPVTPALVGTSGGSSYVECWVLGADYRSPWVQPVTIGRLNVTDYPSLSRFAQIMSHEAVTSSTSLVSWTKPV
jgi:hypothetical protein